MDWYSFAIVIPPVVVTPTVIDGAGWAAIIASVAVLVTSLTGLVIAFRTKAEVTKVHQVVNSRTDQQLARIDQLAQALQAAGINIPVIPVVKPPLT